MKNILFIASEAVPFIKTGGLADVVGSLPKCFDKQYFDVRVMIPCIFSHEAQQFILCRRKMQLLIPHIGTARCKIDPQSAICINRLCCLGFAVHERHSPFHNTQPRQQLFYRKRLCEIIISTCVQCVYFITMFL